MKKNSIFGKLALLFVAIAWGSSMVVIKGSTDTLPAGALLACRFTVAGVLLALANIKKLKQLDKDYIKSGIFIGICLFMAYFTQTIGVMLEMPGKSHFLSSAYCVFVPFLGWLILKEKPKAYHIIAAAMCAIGIILVSVAGNFSISYGDSISIISSVFWASQIIAIAKWGKDKDPALITMLQFVVCAVLAWVFTLTMEDPGAIQWNMGAVGGVLYLGIVCSGICFLLQTIAQKTENPTSVSIILSFENIFGLVFGAIFFNEKFTPRSIMGFVMIFAAIIIAETEFSFSGKKSKKQ
ncbi:DMT family transporter [Faecalimonas sp.]